MIDVEDLLRAELDRLLHRSVGRTGPTCFGSRAPSSAAVAEQRSLRRAHRCRSSRCDPLATPLGAAIAHGLGGSRPGSAASPARRRRRPATRVRTSERPLVPRLPRRHPATPARDSQGAVRWARSAAARLPRRRHPLPPHRRDGKESRLTAELRATRRAETRRRPGARCDGRRRLRERPEARLVRHRPLRGAAVQVTAGITAHGVRAVTLHDNAGTHRFLLGRTASSTSPGTRNRPARRCHLRPHGHAGVDVPFAPAPWGGAGGSTGPPPRPVRPR